MERAVWKLKEEKEKQTAMEERRRSARGKRKLKGCLPTASKSGGESTQGPTPVEVERGDPKPTRRMATTGGPGWDEGPLRRAAEPGRRDLGAKPRWREERWRRELGMEYCGRWERNRRAPRSAEYRWCPKEGWVDRRCPSPNPRERGRW